MLKVAPIQDKLRANRLRWFGNVTRRPSSAPIRKSDLISIEGRLRGKGIPKLTWVEMVKKDKIACDLIVDIVLNRAEWKTMIYIADRTSWENCFVVVVVVVVVSTTTQCGDPYFIWGTWFMYNLENAHPHNEGSIIKVTNGYWKSMDNLRILTSTLTFGRKTTRDFYEGKEPFEIKTKWRMLEYQGEQLTAQGSNKSQDQNTLCRFLLQNDERSVTRVQSETVNSEGQYLESMLLGLLEQEERDFSPGDDASNGSQVAGEGEQLELELSSIHPQGLVNGHSVGGAEADYDFSKEEFLELKDLDNPELSTSSSDNSSIMSMNSNECSLPREIYIESEGGLNLDEQHVEFRISIGTSVRSDPIIRPLPSPAIFSNNNLVVSENTAPSSSTDEQQHDSDASTSGSSHGSHSGSSQRDNTSSPTGSKSVCRMAKLGKRYCCFGSF